jgi:hypothetical protein
LCETGFGVVFCFGDLPESHSSHQNSTNSRFAALALSIGDVLNERNKLPIPVRSSVSDAHTPGAPAVPPPPSASLYVGNLDKDVREDDLFQIFSVVGPICSIRVLRDHVSRVSLGYAYVNFASAQDAERALETLNYYSIKGRPCRIMWKQRDPSLRKSGVGNIIIKNMDASVTSRDLLDTFSQFGNILSCKVATTEKGKSKGFGFVQYQTLDDAEKAVKCTNGQKLTKTQSLALVVAHHVPAEKMQRKRTESVAHHVPAEKMEGSSLFVGNISAAAGAPVAVVPAPNKNHLNMNSTDLAAMLAQATPEQQRQLLGERLYMLIVTTQSQLAGKITGMLLDDLDTAELLGLIDSPLALDEKIKLALHALQKRSCGQG